MANVKLAGREGKTRSQRNVCLHRAAPVVSPQVEPGTGENVARREAAVPSVQCIIPVFFKDVVLGGG